MTVITTVAQRDIGGERECQVLTQLLFMSTFAIQSNTVLQRQRIYQSDSRPVYQRLPRSRMYMTIYMAFFTVGMFGTFGGLVNAARVSISARQFSGRIHAHTAHLYWLSIELFLMLT